MKDEEIKSATDDFLIGIFLPGILTFVAGWTVFRLYLNETLIDMGLPPIVPQPGYGAIATGYGRFVLLIAISFIVTLFSFIIYTRLFKDPSTKAN